MDAEWFLPTMGRAEAESFLSGKPSGTFIVRASTQAESYALSYLDEKLVVNHSLIKKCQLGYILPDIPHAVFPTLLALVSACNFLRPIATSSGGTLPPPGMSRDAMIKAVCEAFPHTSVEVVKKLLEENNWNETAASNALLSMAIAEPTKKEEEMSNDYVSSDPMQGVVLNPLPARSMNLDLLMAKVEAAARGTTIPTTVPATNFTLLTNKLPKGAGNVSPNGSNDKSHYAVNKFAPPRKDVPPEKLAYPVSSSPPLGSPQSSDGKIPTKHVQQIYNSTNSVVEMLEKNAQQNSMDNYGVIGNPSNNAIPNNANSTSPLRTHSSTAPVQREKNNSPQTSPRERDDSAPSKKIRMSVVAVFLEHFKGENKPSPSEIMERWHQLPKHLEASVHGSFEANLYKVLQNLEHPLGQRVKEFINNFNSSALNVTCARAIGETQNFIAALQHIIASKVPAFRDSGGEQVVWRVITTALFPSIYENLYKLASDQSESSNSAKRKKMKALIDLDIVQYGITTPNGFSKSSLDSAIKRLDEMASVTTVREKLDCLSAVLLAVHDITIANPIKADDLPAYLAYLLVHSNVNDLVTQWLLMRNFTPSFCAEGIEGFALATLEATIDFLNSDAIQIQPTQNNGNSNPVQQSFTRATSKTNAPEPARNIIMGKARKDTLLRRGSDGTDLTTPPVLIPVVQHHASLNTNLNSYDSEGGMAPFPADPLSPRQGSSPGTRTQTTFVQIPNNNAPRAQPASPTLVSVPQPIGEVSDLPRGRTNSENFAPILDKPFNPGPDPSVLQSKGNNSTENLAFEKLEKEYIEALKEMKGNTKALNKLAAFYNIEGNFAKALDKTDKVLKMDPKNVVAKTNFPIYLANFQGQYQT